MKLLRRVLLIAATTSFRLTIFFGVPMIGLLIFAGKPAFIEKTLVQTSTYHQFVPAIVQSLGSASKGSNTIPFDDPGVQKIVNDALPPQTVQRSTETIINSMYDWLEGKTEHPQFRLDFTQNRQVLSENITLYGFNHLTQQPLCKADPPTVNPFTATCLPRNFSINLERQQFAAAINGLFPKTVFTANDLPRLAGGKSIAHDFPQAHTWYGLILLVPWVIGGLLILLAIVIIELSRSRRQGVRLLGSVVLSSGIALLITPVLYLLVYPHVNNALRLQSANTGINVLIDRLLQTISHSFYDYLIKGSLVVINLGFAILLAERLTRSKKYEHVAQRAGVVSGDGTPGRADAVGLSSDMIPIQTSEQAAKPKAKRRFQRLRKQTDKELS